LAYRGVREIKIIYKKCDKCGDKDDD